MAGVQIKPPTIALTEGQTVVFEATDANGAPLAVTWAINPPTVGAITQAAGPLTSVTYTAPERIPSAQLVTLTATAGVATVPATITLLPVLKQVSPMIKLGGRVNWTGALRYIVLLAGGVAAYLIYRLHPDVIRFKSFSAAEFTQQLTPLVLVALFIERSLEVFLNVWRGGQETNLQRAVDKATDLAKADPNKIHDVHTAQDKLANYRSETQQIAIPASLALGILISALGIRGLGTLLDPTEFAKLGAAQQALFKIADTLLTGALLGGGSDFMHRVITTFTDLMTATSQKATGKSV